MLKITEKKRDGETVILQLEGRIVGQWVDEIFKECEARFSNQRKILLDVSEVYFADDHGVQALKALMGDRVQLIGCSMFLSELLKLEDCSETKS